MVTKPVQFYFYQALIKAGSVQPWNIIISFNNLLAAETAGELYTFLRTVLGLEDGILGSVMTIQTFGDYAKWHPHIHSITADGLFRANGVFHVMPRVDTKPLAELFRAEILKMLKKEGLIDVLWQIGKRSDTEDYKERVELDRWYILNASIGLDLKIIFKTVLRIFSTKGAY